MHRNDSEILSVIRLFHDAAPVSTVLTTIRTQPDDSRWMLTLEYPDCRRIVKLACNAFTTATRINAWPRLIEQYRMLGYYSPALLPGRDGQYVQHVAFRGLDCLAWEEEFAPHRFASDVPRDERIGADGRYVYHDDLIALQARVAQLRLSGFPGVSGWARLVPFEPNAVCDELSDCVAELDGLVRTQAPHMLPRWERVMEMYRRNRTALERIYPQLPTSAFQADWNESNLLLDADCHLVGLIDYNLAGEDTALNMFMSMLYGCGSYDCPECGPDELPGLHAAAQDAMACGVLRILRVARAHYSFCDAEIEAAPLLYRYITGIEYAQLQAFRDNANDDHRLGLLFDSIERAFTHDVDFVGAMRP